MPPPDKHPLRGLVDVYAAIIPAFPFRAGLHVNYQEHVLRVVDGLRDQRRLFRSRVLLKVRPARTP